MDRSAAVSSPPQRELPPPLHWPTARMIRNDRIAAVLLTLLALAPCVASIVLLLRSPPGQGDGAVGLLMVALIMPATLGVVVYVALDRRERGLVLRAIRGGPQAVIEVRSRRGVGGGLVLLLGEGMETQRVYRMGQKRFVIADASVSTAAGTVIFARGGTSLDREMVQWIDAVAGSEGTAEPSEDVMDPDEIAAAASREPLAAPPGIEASLVGGWHTWRYRSTPDHEHGVILPWMALMAAWLAVLPAFGIFRTGPLAAFVVPVELLLAYALLLSAPITMEFQVRANMLVVKRKRFGLTLSIGVSEAAQAGIDIVGLPKVSLAFDKRRRGVTSPLAGGPDVIAMTWLSAAIRSSASRAR